MLLLFFSVICRYAADAVMLIQLRLLDTDTRVFYVADDYAA